MEEALPPAGAAPGVEPTAPSVAEGAWKRVDPRTILAGRLAGGVGTAVTAVAILVVLVPVELIVELPLHVRWTLPIASIGLLAVVAAWGYAWPKLRYEYLQYKVDPRGIEIRSGVVWRRVVSVPRSRVQHTDVSQGPIQRHFGLATLVVHTAGVVNASVTLGGLERDIAVGIRDFLIDESLADGV